MKFKVGDRIKCDSKPCSCKGEGIVKEINGFRSDSVRVSWTKGSNKNTINWCREKRLTKIILPKAENLQQAIELEVLKLTG